MFYDRKIKYLELFEKGMKLQGAGFVKIEIRDGNVNMLIRVDKLKTVGNTCGKVMLIGKEKEGLLGELNLRAGQGSLEIIRLPYENLVAGIGYQDVEELVVVLQQEKELRCRLADRVIEMPEQKEGSKEEKTDDVPLPQPVTEVAIASLPMQRPELGENMEEKWKQETTKDKKEEFPQLALQMEREGNDVGIHREERQNVYSVASTKWQQLWNRFPHIIPFEDKREYLQIKPEDFVILTKDCYTLCGNSFLLHGYYNYEHLILVKELQEGKERYYVGVPGNFYVKEKQVAVLYGFESFEGKTEPAKSGDFGYYMISVEI